MSEFMVVVFFEDIGECTEFGPYSADAAKAVTQSVREFASLVGVDIEVTVVEADP